MEKQRKQRKPEMETNQSLSEVSDGEEVHTMEGGQSWGVRIGCPLTGRGNNARKRTAHQKKSLISRCYSKC